MSNPNQNIEPSVLYHVVQNHGQEQQRNKIKMYQRNDNRNQLCSFTHHSLIVSDAAAAQHCHGDWHQCSYGWNVEGGKGEILAGAKLQQKITTWSSVAGLSSGLQRRRSDGQQGSVSRPQQSHGISLDWRTRPGRSSLARCFYRPPTSSSLCPAWVIYYWSGEAAFNAS